MADPLEWVPRTVWVRLAARRFFDDHGPLGIEHVNEMPQMPDGANHTSLRGVPGSPTSMEKRLSVISDIARDGLDHGPPHDHQIDPREALAEIKRLADGGFL